MTRTGWPPMMSGGGRTCWPHSGQVALRLLSAQLIRSRQPDAPQSGVSLVPFRRMLNRDSPMLPVPRRGPAAVVAPCRPRGVPLQAHRRDPPLQSGQLALAGGLAGQRLVVEGGVALVEGRRFEVDPCTLSATVGGRPGQLGLELGDPLLD